MLLPADVRPSFGPHGCHGRPRPPWPPWLLGDLLRTSQHLRILSGNCLLVFESQGRTEGCCLQSEGWTKAARHPCPPCLWVGPSHWDGRFSPLGFDRYGMVHILYLFFSFPVGPYSTNDSVQPKTSSFSTWSLI